MFSTISKGPVYDHSLIDVISVPFSVDNTRTTMNGPSQRRIGVVIQKQNNILAFLIYFTSSMMVVYCNLLLLNNLIAAKPQALFGKQSLTT
jgi:hypothetical protein